MDYFPAFLRLKGRDCLLVGGGAVAARKARLLLDAGAELTVVSPAVCDELARLADAGRLVHRRRCFKLRDLDRPWLVVSATGNPAVEALVFAECDRRRIFCNAVDDRQSCSYITPAIVDRSPVIVAISSGGSAPVLARRLRARIEALLPAGLGELASLSARWRARVQERFTNFNDRLRFWEHFFDAPVAPGGDADRRMQDAIERYETDARGEAWLVGAGPGDPDLLTLKALQCLQSADVIVHDRLVSSAVLDLARRDAERISVGKQAGGAGTSQEAINALLIRLVREGRRVCRLKGGDPFIFGRGGEEADALAAEGLRCSIVPGVTAAAGCAAAAGIPLTHRDDAQSVAFVTAHGKDSVDKLDWPSLARDRQTLAVYMGVSRFAEIAGRLIEHGRAPDTPVAVIENGTTPRQRVLRGTLAQLPLLSAAHRVVSPAMLIIGAVAARGRVRLADRVEQPQYSAIQHSANF